MLGVIYIHTHLNHMIKSILQVFNAYIVIFDHVIIRNYAN